MPSFRSASAARRGRGSAGYGENETMATRFPRSPGPGERTATGEGSGRRGVLAGEDAGIFVDYAAPVANTGTASACGSRLRVSRSVFILFDN